MVGCWAILWFSSLTLVYHSGCYLIDTIAANSFSHLHNYINASTLDQDYCEKKLKLTTLDEWKLSTEIFTATLPIDHIQGNYVREVQDCIFSVGYPTPFKSRVLLVAVSEEVLEEILDLDTSASSSDDFLQLVSGTKIIFGSLPLTHRYGGHQFGSWAGQLGDGRAHLIGIYTNRFGSRWELQLKGSGRTPYSRRGDGRAVLRSSIREFLGSEAMHYLGIPTSRAASLVVSDDNIWRDQFYNGNIKKERGVCNTDNFSLLSITIDYGPFGFMDSYNPDFVPNTSDDEGRYKIGNQANVGMFNLNKLLKALNPLFSLRQKQLASQILERYPQQYYKGFVELFKAKLGLLGENEDDGYLIAFLLKLMQDTRADFTMTFRQLSEISEDKLKDLNIPKVRFLKQVLQHPFLVQTLAERAGYAQHPPAWAEDVKVSCSS
ncbi:hypothetical protein E2320_001669 [Naja naja]|nr:hypothetical protein E2320_001669 [Naja naja]